MKKNIQIKAKSSFKYNYLLSIFSNIWSFIFSIIIVRLLFPKDFGILVFADLINGFIVLFANVGISSYYFQKKIETREQEKAELILKDKQLREEIFKTLADKNKLRNWALVMFIIPIIIAFFVLIFLRKRFNSTLGYLAKWILTPLSIFVLQAISSYFFFIKIFKEIFRIVEG